MSEAGDLESNHSTVSQEGRVSKLLWPNRPLPVFVNKVLSGYSHNHVLYIVCGCFYDTVAELIHGNRDCMNGLHILKHLLICPVTEKVSGPLAGRV